MGDGDSTKDDGKEDRRSKGWTICPYGVGIIRVITLVTHDGCCRGRSRALKRKKHLKRNRGRGSRYDQNLFEVLHEDVLRGISSRDIFDILYTYRS